MNNKRSIDNDFGEFPGTLRKERKFNSENFENFDILQCITNNKPMNLSELVGLKKNN